MTNVTVLGAGAWGTAFGQVLADAGNDVTMWAIEPEIVEGIRDHHHNGVRLPVVEELPHNMTATGDRAEAVKNADIIVVAIAPGLFTKQDPNACDLGNSLSPASAGHPFGYDLQGCDVYTRVVYGTRTSLSVGVLSTLLVVIVGTLIGAVAGFFGGWIDAVLSRITDIFFALPMLLGAIVVLQMFKTSKSIWKIVLVLTLFGWVGVCRIARSAVLESKNLEFNTASTALGSTPARNLFRHILPNSLAPIIVIATTSLASYIVAEATLSFLGVGLPTTTVSWGGDISSAQTNLQTDPMVLFYPSAALAITVLAFIMMGDAVKDALDPKSRTA